MRLLGLVLGLLGLLAGLISPLLGALRPLVGLLRVVLRLLHLALDLLHQSLRLLSPLVGLLRLVLRLLSLTLRLRHTTQGPGTGSSPAAWFVAAPGTRVFRLLATTPTRELAPGLTYASAIIDPRIAAELVDSGFKGLLIGTGLLRADSIRGWVEEFERHRAELKAPVVETHPPSA